MAGTSFEGLRYTADASAFSSHTTPPLARSTRARDPTRAAGSRVARARGLALCLSPCTPGSQCALTLRTRPTLGQQDGAVGCSPCRSTRSILRNVARHAASHRSLPARRPAWFSKAARRECGRSQRPLVALARACGSKGTYLERPKSSSSGSSTNSISISSSTFLPRDLYSWRGQQQQRISHRRMVPAWQEGHILQTKLTRRLPVKAASSAECRAVQRRRAQAHSA